MKYDWLDVYIDIFFGYDTVLTCKQNEFDVWFLSEIGRFCDISSIHFVNIQVSALKFVKRISI